jgi:predicted RNA-binding Zn ribbon-like protein
MTTGAGAVLVAMGPRSLCLDYANTRCWRGRPNPKETLHRPADLMRWCRRAGLPTPPAWRAAAAGLFSEAICLREVIYRVFSALATGDVIPASDLAALNAAIARAPPRARIAALGVSYAWLVEAPVAGAVVASAAELLASVLWSAADLVVAVRPGSIRQCANDPCRWLFLDESRNAARRWCDMGSCGNRAKARRHYLKHRGA